MTEDQIKYMVDRFLGWKLPSNFSPDAGISFKADYNEHTAYPAKHEPTGTNLFDASQADAMVRYMVEGLYPTLASETEGGKSVVPVGSRVRQEKVYAGTRDGSVTWSYATEFTVVWDGVTVACTYDASYLKPDAKCPISVIAPSRASLIAKREGK